MALGSGQGAQVQVTGREDQVRDQVQGAGDVRSCLVLLATSNGGGHDAGDHADDRRNHHVDGEEQIGLELDRLAIAQE